MRGPVLAEFMLEPALAHVVSGRWEMQGLKCHSETLSTGRVVRLWDRRNNITSETVIGRETVGLDRLDSGTTVSWKGRGSLSLLPHLHPNTCLGTVSSMLEL